MSTITSTCRRVAWGVVVASGAAVLGLSSPGDAATPTAPTAPVRGPGVFGSVAAISGTSMEVQNPQTGQTTVDWTSSTTFTQTASVSLSAVRSGVCVSATGTLPRKAKTSKKSKKTKTKKTATVFTARTIAISAPTSKGTCAGPGGFPGSAGASRTFTGNGRPPGGLGGSAGSSGRFRRAGSNGKGGGAARGGFASLGFASGTVTVVGTHALTVHGVSFAGFGRAAGARARASGPGKKGSSKARKPKEKVFSVGVTSATAYSEAEAATASNLALGDCVSARGTSASNGAVTASVVQITSSGGGTCGGGFPVPGGSGGGTASSG